MRLKLIACEIVYREVCLCVAQSRNIVDVEFVTKGLHSLEDTDMCRRLQERVDAVDQRKYKAVALAYALCNNGVVGLTARGIPLVLPRAHDCITFLFGSRQAYQQYFDRQPGTYFVSTGWKERDSVHLENVEDDGIMAHLGLNRTYQQYVEKYGEDNARYIMQVMGGWVKNYDRCLYVDMGIREDLGYDQQARDDAAGKGWSFERTNGDLTLLRKLADADWDDDFLIVPPGQRIEASHDEGIVKAVAV